MILDGEFDPHAARVNKRPPTMDELSRAHAALSADALRINYDRTRILATAPLTLQPACSACHPAETLAPSAFLYQLGELADD